MAEEAFTFCYFGMYTLYFSAPTNYLTLFNFLKHGCPDLLIGKGHTGCCGLVRGPNVENSLKYCEMFIVQGC